MKPCRCQCHDNPSDFPWCLDCVKRHGNARRLLLRLRHYHRATRPGYPTWPDNTIFGEAANEIDKLTATLAACGLALRQECADPAAVISEILKGVGL